VLSTTTTTLDELVLTPDIFPLWIDYRFTWIPIHTSKWGARAQYYKWHRRLRKLGIDPYAVGEVTRGTHLTVLELMRHIVEYMEAGFGLLEVMSSVGWVR